MEDMQAQIGAILNDPEAMSKIMAMAQAFGESAATPQEAPGRTAAPESPGIDPALLQKLAGLAGQSGIDSRQRELLHALGPYLKHDRLQKLEKAMRAAKMARMASSFIGVPGLMGEGR